MRSRRPEEVQKEVEQLAANGYQEVVLTGIHLSSYGVDLEKGDLLSLIETVHRVQGIRRIRLGSLEPRIITEEFVQVLAGMEKLCPHFHLSLQSGCDTVLKRMNRRYSTEEYEKACILLRRAFEHPALTTDVIVGFPGETQEEFEKTEEFLKHIQFFQTHIFKYSRRKGTKADRMEGQITEAVKAERSRILLKLNAENEKRYLKEQLGCQVEILVEEPIEVQGNYYQSGHTKEYCKAIFSSKRNFTGQVVQAVAEKQLENEFLLCKLI